MRCQRFTCQRDIHVPPAAKSKIPSSRARMFTLPKAPSVNKAVVAHPISSYKPCQNSHWLPGSRARYSGSPLPAHSWKAAYAAVVLIARQDGCLCELWEASKYGSQVCFVLSFCTKHWPRIMIECTKTYFSLKMTYFSTINGEKKCIVKCGALLLKLSILSRVSWEL